MFDKSRVNKAYSDRKLTQRDRHRQNYVEYLLSFSM